MKRPRLTEAARLAILRDYRNGMDRFAIAKKHGVNSTYARVLARRRGMLRQDMRREYR